MLGHNTKPNNLQQFKVTTIEKKQQYPIERIFCIVLYRIVGNFFLYP